MKVMVLNDGETYTDVDGCHVIQGTTRQIELVLEDGRDCEYERVGEVTVSIWKIKKVHRED